MVFLMMSELWGQSINECVAKNGNLSKGPAKQEISSLRLLPR